MTRVPLPPPEPGKKSWPWVETTPLRTGPAPGNKTWPRITVVTPSYNQGRFIEETIRSVLLQAYPNLEYFILDGGSGDGSVAILQKYAPWLQKWVSEEDRGQAHAVNKGWAQSTGDILGWLNSDDIYTPNTLFRVAEAWLEYDRPGIVYGDAAGVDESLKPFNHKSMARFDLAQMISGKRVAQPAAFLSKKMHAHLGPLDESLRYALDYEYFLRAWLQPDSNRFAYIPHILAYSRHQDERKSDTGRGKFIDENIDVLKDAWRKRMTAHYNSPDWKLAYARGLVTEGDKYFSVGQFKSAWKTYLDASKQSLRVLPYLMTRILRTSIRRILRRSH